MRLIDADALERHVYMEWVNGEISNSEWIDFRQWLKDEPTVEPASPWRSMEDNGPPEEKGPYFVYAPSYRGGSSSGKERAMGVMISRWTGKHWRIEVGYYERPGCVTHWMPIKPPKEE